MDATNGVPANVVGGPWEQLVEQGYRCLGCEDLFSEDDVDVDDRLYECGECGSVFTLYNSADGDGNRCPECMRFSARVHDASGIPCPNCSEAELEEVELECCESCGDLRLVGSDSACGCVPPEHPVWRRRLDHETALRMNNSRVRDVFERRILSRTRTEFRYLAWLEPAELESYYHARLSSNSRRLENVEPDGSFPCDWQEVSNWLGRAARRHGIRPPLDENGGGDA